MVSDEKREKIWEKLVKVPNKQKSTILYFLCGYCHRDDTFWNGLDRITDIFIVKEMNK